MGPRAARRRQTLRCPCSRRRENIIYEGTPHGKAKLAFFFFFLNFLLVLNLIYFAVEYVELGDCP